MIEDYIAASRRTRPTDPTLQQMYMEYYGRIVEHIKPSGSSPQLFITFSSDRKCELIGIGAADHLVYDQYLGQSFNRLNRIQFAAHGAPELSMAYASKYVAERLLCLGRTGPAAFFAAVSRQFEQHAREEGDPFDVPSSLNRLRSMLTAAQEVFVMAHEMAHHRWRLDHVNLREEISFYVQEFLAHKQELAESEGERRPDHVPHYRETLNRAPVGFLEEVFADDFGGLIAFRVAVGMGIPAWLASTGVIFAFKYLRLFRHLELLSHRISDLASETDTAAFSQRLGALEHDIWDAEAGHIREFQFREHFVRYRLRLAQQQMASYDPDEQMAISELIEEYDDKTEFPVVFGLLDRLKESFTREVMAELTTRMNGQPDSVEFVDRLTGWTK